MLLQQCGCQTGTIAHNSRLHCISLSVRAVLSQRKFHAQCFSCTYTEPNRKKDLTFFFFSSATKTVLIAFCILCLFPPIKHKNRTAVKRWCGPKSVRSEIQPLLNFNYFIRVESTTIHFWMRKQNNAPHTQQQSRTRVFAPPCTLKPQSFVLLLINRSNQLLLKSHFLANELLGNSLTFDRLIRRIRIIGCSLNAINKY